MLRRSNLNEKLNFKNSLYTGERSASSDQQLFTLFGYRNAFLKLTDDANTRASTATINNIKKLEDKQNQIKEFLLKTEEIVEDRKVLQYKLLLDQ